jgi:8-oxo-dGTP diphosphatase
MASYIEWIRDLVGTRKLLLVFASACVADSQGRVLWQFRTDFNTWGLPGGVLELDETLEECLIREVKEETGLEVEAGRLIGIYSAPRFDVVYPNGDQVQQVTFLFETRLIGGHLQPDLSETRQLAWFEAQKPPSTFPWYQAMIADFNLASPSACFDHGAAAGPRPSVPFYRQLREFIGHQRFISPGAAAFVQNSAGEVLLMQRTDTHLWTLPGGLMELGEQLDQTAEFETWEETGLQVKAEKLLAYGSGNNLNFDFPNGDVVRCVAALFRCRAQGGMLHSDAVESAAVGFFNPRALPPLMPDEEKWIEIGLQDPARPLAF